MEDIVQRIRKLTGEMDDRELALHGLFGHLDDLAVVHDGAQILMVSPSFRRLLGWRETDTLGRPWEDFLHEDDRGECGRRACRKRAKTHDGAFLWVDWICTHDEQQKVFYCLGRNVDPLVKAERELVRVKDLLEGVLENAIDGILTINADDELIWPMNTAASNMFGYGREELLGKTIHVLMPEPLRADHKEAIKKYLKTGKPDHVIGKIRRLQGKRKDGTVFPFEISVSEFELEGERVFTGVLRDLSRVER